MKTTFPMKFRMSGAALEEFEACEWGSYEDAGHPEPGDPWQFPGEGSATAYGYDSEGPQEHAVNILNRFKSQIVVNNADELETVWYCLSSGTFQIHCRTACYNLAEKMREPVREHCPAIMERWNGPYE